MLDKYSSTSLPKPPLAKKNNPGVNPQVSVQHSVSGPDEISSEAILKMADESIATIDR